MPASAKHFFNIMMETAALDYYDTDQLYMDLLQVKETQALSPNFSLSGFE